MNREELMGAFSYAPPSFRCRKLSVILPADTMTFFAVDSVLSTIRELRTDAILSRCSDIQIAGSAGSNATASAHGMTSTLAPRTA